MLAPLLPDHNTYNATEFRQTFVVTDVYKSLENYFDIILWENVATHTNNIIPGITPRQGRGSRIVSTVPFWYISQLPADQPIYDIGCGWNMYSKYYKNIIGIGGENPDSEFFYGDVHGHVDASYAAAHYESFNNIITMNAMHFRPLEELNSVIQMLLSMLQPGGYLFLMLNVSMLSTYSRQQLGIEHTALDITNVIRQTMFNYKTNIISFQLEEDNIEKNMSDGTLRVLFKK